MVKKKQVEPTIEELAVNEVQRFGSVTDLTADEVEIQGLAEKHNLDATELVAEYQKQYSELLAKGVKVNLERMSMNAVKNLVRKKTKPAKVMKEYAKAEAVTGFIWGDSGCWDKIDTMRGTAKRYVDKNGLQMAVKEGLINEEAETLDTRKKVFGKDNPEYGKPLKPNQHERSRTLYMIAKVNGDENFKSGTIQTNDNQLALGWGKVKFFTPAQTFGIVKENNGTFKLNSSNAEDTKSIFKRVQEDIDVDTTFMDVVTPLITPLENLEEEHKLSNNAWDRMTFIRGVVTWIGRDRPTPWGTIKMRIWNPEEGTEVTISVPQHIALDFGENSEIIAGGKTVKGNLKVDGDDGKPKYLKGEGDVELSAVGVYAIKGLCTPNESGSAESLEEEKEINAWVE